MALLTPETDPDDFVIGRHFRAWDGHVYYCDSYDTNMGFWMTRSDAPPGHLQDQHGEWRRNVSERAIGRTYHRIWVDPGCRPLCQYGPVDPSLLTISA